MNAFTEWMSKVGLRPTDVARALGLRDTAVWKYRREHYWPTRDVALRIKRFTGGEVSMDALLDDTVPIETTQEYQLGLDAIEEAKQRKEDRDAKRAREEDGEQPGAEGGWRSWIREPDE
jgi:plasmid maintenance system antidote protein VapI